jgi:hypothetical protein
LVAKRRHDPWEGVGLCPLLAGEVSMELSAQICPERIDTRLMEREKSNKRSVGSNKVSEAIQSNV